MARLVALANAVAAALADAELSLTIQPERCYRPEQLLDQPEAANLAVYVRPRTFPKQAEGMLVNTTRYQIDIVVQQRLDSLKDPDSIDPLVTLCEEIADWLLAHSIDAHASCESATPENEVGAIYDEEWLYAMNTFYAVIVATYQQTGG